ncbi:dolichyl-diphosphooligosaccharide--protein glycosyltransferase subunit 1 [Schistocerca nitens]|uniref:dolichyl-diphosphooligosaccharide--protein glycosyltransferase subunit 1 n=1 Tax=Schistocerca nitens TaxID=7011 RepID=UPI0021182529|nr:dolichyl-diphosphooligosaccharide--protein glycosyltransferase subunit 1 [Schistocerca nitens]
MRVHICVFLVCSSVISVISASVCENLQIRNAERAIDLTSQLVKIGHTITFENIGKVTCNSFKFAIDPKLAPGFAFISAQSGDSSKTSLGAVENAAKGTWNIALKEPLSSGKTVTVEVETVFTHQLKPHPASISQKEKQLVLYHGSTVLYSPYTAIKQTTTVTLASKNIESYTKHKPVAVSDNVITYGPYEKVQPFSQDKMIIHFENNAPFLTVTNLLRTIEVSHWGNIAVEETIDLLHTGATLKGPFSRYEYQREAQSGLSSVKSFKTILPAAATDAYYRDEIGNISTSHMKVLSDSVELDLRPRFPLFGGWKTHYTIGYNVPSYEYLYNSGDDYLLKMRFIDHVFDDMIVDEVTTKVILPEGSHNIEKYTPYPVETMPDSHHFTYLDTNGRPVIMWRKKNLVENHIQDFKLQYRFPRIFMLQEPLLVIVAFYLLFLMVIIYVRIDFSISKDEVSETRMRVAGYCEKVLAYQDKRAQTFARYDEQLAKLKTTKDINSFQSAMKSINQEYKAQTSAIAELLLKLKDAPDIVEKVSELQKADRQLKELYSQHQSLYVDKVIPGKSTRAQIDTENQINKKKEECIEKINAIVKSLQ